MLKQNIANLLESEMDRKDFLKTLGIAIVAFTGVTAAVKTITNHSASLARVQSSQGKKLSYGSSAYGGARTVVEQKNSYS